MTEETKKVSASDYPVGLLSSAHVKTALTNKVLSQKLAKLSSEDFDALSSRVAITAGLSTQKSTATSTVL